MGREITSDSAAGKKGLADERQRKIDVMQRESVEERERLDVIQQ